MAYFGGAGVEGDFHPSLKAYIDCFLSSPFPKMYPRGGGPWDQDPILMRHFRLIMKFEREWKQVEAQMDSMKGKGGDGLGLGNAMQEYLDQLGESGTF